MPVSVDLLFKEIGLEYSKPYRWNEKLDANINGVYVISTSNNPFTSESKVELNI